eukprot:m.193460 g.193460  ORF g.193460 m.193460 type:complete len:149 (-) comp21766_c0_seq1:1623-2069(-)
MSDPSGAHAYHSMEMGPAGITSGASRLEGPHSFWEERELGSVVNLQLGSGYGGSTDRLDESGTEDHTQQLLALNDTHGTRKDDHKLGQLLATSISGNDITSSALYVVGYNSFTSEWRNVHSAAQHINQSSGRPGRKSQPDIIHCYVCC